MKPKFGDRLRNTAAGEGNPHRDAFYIRTVVKAGRLNPGTFYEMTDGEGEVWNQNPQHLVPLTPSADVALPEPLRRWVWNRESDIAFCMEDFGDLAGIYEKEFGYKPRRNNPGGEHYEPRDNSPRSES